MIRVKIIPISISGYVSQIYSGLFDLHAEKKIKLEFGIKPIVSISERKDWGKATNSRIFYLEVYYDDGRAYTFCYDLIDGPEIISLSGLEKCDFYFKRSYSTEFSHNDKETNDPLLRSKIYPYGLNACWGSDFEFAHIRRLLIYGHHTKQLYRKPIRSFKRISKAFISEGKSLKKNIPHEISPNEPSEQKILFQTRLFESNYPQHAEEVHKLNEFRTKIVRALKDEFGDRFIGGLFPDKQAIDSYPELITSFKTNQKEYLSLVKSCQIVIFTRGRRQSTGFRLPEYLAMSRCIVSEPLAYELPEELVDGKNILTFTNENECIAACHTLLDDQDLAVKMRNSNFDYYHRNVKPASIIWNTINIAKDKQ